MTKRRLTYYLVIGIIAGLFVSACAGVATGKVALPGSGDVLTFGPAVDAQSAPSLAIAGPGHSAQFVFEKARPLETESLDAESLAVHAQSLVTSQTALETMQQAQTQYQHPGLCSRAGH